MPKRKFVQTELMPPIEDIPIGDVHPYEGNPRFNDDAVDAVAASIREFGWKQPIVIDNENVIVAGHTRLLAAKKLGMVSVPCIRAADLTEEQVRAYRLVDNKTNELAVWDDIKLDAEIDALPEYDFTQFGFNYNADDLLDGFGDDDEDGDGGTDGIDIEKSKVSFKIPREHIKKVMAYIKKHGQGVFVDFILVTCGCVTPEPLAEESSNEPT